MPELTLTKKLTEGDIAEIHEGEYGGERVIVKTAMDAANNDLIFGEAAMLSRLLPSEYDPNILPSLEDIAKMQFSAYLPRHVATSVDDQGREYNVLKPLDGLYPLSQIVADLGPLNAKDLAWIWRRVLTAIGHVHRQGIVHAAIYPEHIMIEPTQHGVVLIDWCYAREIGQPAVAYISKYHDSLPREILRKRGLTSGTDVKMATQAMLSVVDQGSLPPVLKSFTQACMNGVEDAWLCKEKFDVLIERQWGKRTFRAMTYTPKVTA